MKRAARALAAVVTAAALTLAGQSFSTASAKPTSSHAAHAKAGKAGKPAKGPKSKAAKAPRSQVRQVLRDIARLTAALDRAVRASRIGTLPADQQAAVVANVAADKATLAALADAARGGTVTDLRQVRRDLRALRVENYTLAVNVLRGAGGLTDTAAANADVAALVDTAVTKALAVTATSPRSLVKEARAALAAAEDLADQIVEPTEPTDPTEPADPTEPTEPEAPVQG